MLLSIGCFLALWGALPFWHKASAPIVMGTHVESQRSTLPETMVKEEVVIVFIHGSMYVQLAFLSPFCVLYDSFNGKSWYEKTVGSLRHHLSTQQDKVILNSGLLEVTDLINQEYFEGASRYSGACHIMRGLQRAYNKKPFVTYRFYNFGWSGILSERDRRLAAEDLYASLYKLKQDALLRGKTLRIELYAFSHGGQIALHLPAVRKAKGDTAFIIDLVVLSAVPLYYENTRNILMGMFSTVINCYSPGDFAQTIDFFSTPALPHQTIAETMPLPDKKSSIQIVDLAITLGERHPVPHCAFFHINKLHLFPYRARRSPAYKSRYEAAHKFVELLNPLPLVVLYPYLLEPIFSYMQLVESSYQHIKLTLSATAEAFQGSYSMHYPTQDVVVQAAWPLSEHLAAAQKELKEALTEQPLSGQLSSVCHQVLHALSSFWHQ